MNLKKLFMRKKQEIIQTVAETIQANNFLQQSSNFVENAQKLARYSSLNIILTCVNSLKVTYMGNYQICAIINKKNPNGKIRHSLNHYWQGNIGISTLIGIINQYSNSQILRFSIMDDELSSTITSLQKMQNQHFTMQSDDSLQSAYLGKYRIANRLQKKYRKDNCEISKYGNYWLWIIKDKYIPSDELEKIINKR